MSRRMPRFSTSDLPRIEDETGMQPRLIAAGVCQEAADYLVQFELDLHNAAMMAEWLAERANYLYRHNLSFKEKLRGEGGRQQLSSVMRQWLAVRLQEKHPILYARLPAHFFAGATVARPANGF